ncbi:hypothetical protein [Streptomyces sp. KLOTTS4A1]|uniref:hypothetical protein n=1 Tax=Streptomyces sp. KLOTTS4A1 TaxID=3390996 RepID=UPI0039F4D08C
MGAILDDAGLIAQWVCRLSGPARSARSARPARSARSAQSAGAEFDHGELPRRVHADQLQPRFTCQLGELGRGALLAGEEHQHP